MLNESTDAVGPLFSGRLYLPDELDQRLEAEGVSKADLIRRGVTKLLDESRKPRRVKPFPVFRSGRRRSADEMQEELVEQIAERAARGDDRNWWVSGSDGYWPGSRSGRGRSMMVGRP